MHATAGYPEWTETHDLALIYLAMTHGAGEELGSAEMEVVANKLQAWAEDVDAERISDIMHEVILVYVGASGEQMLETAIASIGHQMPKMSRIAILHDLADIASADGAIMMNEVDFIQQLARDWGIEQDVR